MTKKRQIIEKIISSKVYDIAQVTPIDKASNLSKSLKNNIFLKREDLQPTHSFKVRGSYNKIEHLYRKKNVQHVVTASAGNHAQGVALAAKHLKIKATIFMPLTTPKIKVNSVKMLGAKVKLTGNNFDESALAASKYCGQYNLDFIHPFDDELVIAGQGTVGLEIANQFTDNIYAVFIGSGGGGLVSGVGEYLKSIRPDIKIIAVESEDSAALHQTLNSGKRIKLKEVGLFADGTAAKQIGKKNYPIIKDVVDYSMTVNIDEICSAVKDTFIETRTIPEPSGALALAGLKKYVSRYGLKKKNLIAIYCGSNLNFEMLAPIVDRSSMGEQKEIFLGVQIPEVQGSFIKLCSAIGNKNITEFSYRMDDSSTAKVFLGLELESKQKKEWSIKSLKKKFSVIDLSEDEVSKVHLRHMSGGRGPAFNGEEYEEIYMVDFPEKPGALLFFLESLGNQWNISLFHYKNQGALYGGALIGFKVKKNSKKKLEQKLISIGFPNTNQTTSKAYQAFLK